MAHTEKKQFTWSNSRLDTFELCPFKYQQNYLKGIKQVSGPAAERGTEIHGELEKYLKKPKVKIPVEYLHKKFVKLVAQLKKNRAATEQKWAFDRQWVPTKWRGPKTWLRAVTDTYTMLSRVMRIIDFKTGKVYDKHRTQGELYAACGMEYAKKILKVEPKLIVVEFWYLDKGIISEPAHYQQKDVDAIRKSFERRVAMMEMARKFPAMPNWSCRWCQFSRRYNGGKCKEG